MDETKVQIGDDVLLDIGTHSDWYISAICYNSESVNVELRRKINRNNKWWLAEQTEPNCSEKPNNCEPQTDMAEDIVRSFGFKTESYRQAKAKDEPIDRDDLGNCNICKYVGLEHRCNQCVNGSMFCKVEDEPQTDCSWK